MAGYLVQDILFYTFYVGFSALLCLLLKLLKFDFKVMTPIYIIVLFFFVFSYLGLFPLYEKSNEYYVNVGVTDKDRVMLMLLCSISSISMFLVGSLIVTSRFKGSVIENIKEYGTEKYHFNSILAVCCFLALTSVVLIYYISQIDSLAILLIFSSESEEVRLARSSMGNNFGGGYHWYSIIMHDFLYILTLTLYVCCLIDNRKAWHVLFYVSFLMNTFSLLMSTEKAPFIWLLISLMLARLFLINNGRVNRWNMLKVLFLLTVTMSILMSFFMGVDDLFESFLSVLSRVFSGSVAPAYFYLSFIPEYQEYLLGRSFPNPAGILPFEHFRLTVEVMSWRFPELVHRGIVGSSPTVFWAEAYANFSYLGVVFFSLFMGAYVSFAFYLTKALPNTPVSIAFAIWLIMHFKDLSQTGFSGYFFDMKLLLVLLFVMLLNVVLKSSGVNND